MKKLTLSLASLSLLAGWALSTRPVAWAQEGDFAGETVSVGVASEYEEEVWKPVVDRAEAEGITLDLILFTDYVQPNIAVQDGSVDLNAFQHIAFLNDWNDSNDGDLVPLGFTYVAPIRAYSQSLDSLDDLPEGGTVAIPNDPTNGGRALLALEQAGVLEVDDAAGVLPTVNDITSNPKNIQIEELDAAQLPNVLPDVDAAIINNNFALDAGLSVEDAIFSDGQDLDSLADDYKNVIVTRAEDADSPLYQRIVDLYQTEETAQRLVEVSDGADLPAWTPEDAYPLDLSSKD